MVKLISIIRLFVVIEAIMINLAIISNIFAIIVVYLPLYYSLIVVLFSIQSP